MSALMLAQKVTFVAVFSCLPIIFGLKIISRNDGIQQVDEGHNIVLQCYSIDEEHVFMFWYSPEIGIIGPRNHFNEKKFQYEVISGNLTIRRVTVNEAGLYNCVSEGISTQDINAHTIELIVRHGSNAKLWLAWAILGTILIILIILYIFLLRFYKKSDKSNLHRYFDITETNEEEEDSTEELFTREPSTSGVKTKPTKTESDNFEKVYTAININHT